MTQGEQPSNRYILTTNRDASGRDGYILRKALAYAVAAIQSLPAKRREASDRSDMVMILRALVPQRDYRDYLAQGVEAHFGVRPDFEAPDD